ncbi:hypothetical protein [Methyloceanibacter caenitepidi]|uniref:Uncharacterized protein n=1 Tax=Methyloceanibacter caenitepidi TaxID=1384459 RepID=A0A0A8K1Q7_9HYPH|nr:hypothetical protein [Methyloceanibacter caenitepidi]BAQ16746.1 hypothetical protein GL4_1288 [Methyloceanibacter caenitepidi]
MATAKKKATPTARKRAAKPRRRSTPAAAAAAPPPAAPARRWYEHPLLSPVVWTVIGGALTLIWAFGEGLYQEYRDEVMWAPEPFLGDRVGILLARLENDPGNEYASRVRSALEHQFPINADGSASVEVNLYPKKLELPEHGRLSENIIQANAQGREWLKEQKADLLIWGRALPTAKMLELRILTREPQVQSRAAQPELYPIKIPSEFSEQIGSALAGMVAGAGASAWSQRGGYLSPGRAQDLYARMARLKTLQSELPDSLDDETRAELNKNIKMARAQIGGALLADGNSSLAMQVLTDLFPNQDAEKDQSLLTTQPFLAAEIIADVVSQFSAVVDQMSPDDAATIMSLVDQTSRTFDEGYADGTFGKVEYAYLTGLLAKLAGDIETFAGQNDEAEKSYATASEKFETVLAELPATHDALSRARVQSYLGEAQLALARLSPREEAETLLDASIANFTDALDAVSPEAAPRDAVRFGTLMATAELARAEWDVDAAALKRSIEHMQAVLPVLETHGRDDEADGISIQLAALLFSDAVFASGVSGAEKSLALVDDLSASRLDRPAPAAACASMAGEDRANCIQFQEGLAVQEEAALKRGACMGHLAAGYRFDPKGDRLSPTAMAHLKQSFEACEAAANIMLELGNLAGFAEAKLYLANGKRVAGERNKNASQLRDAIAAAEAAQEKLAAIDLPDLKAQTELAKAGALSELGALEGEPDLLREAKQMQLSTLPVYTGKDFAVQRTYAEVQLAQTLTDLAALERTDDELDEAADLLANAQKRYADGGATLAAADAARELKKTQEVRAKLATN